MTEPWEITPDDYAIADELLLSLPLGKLRWMVAGGVARGQRLERDQSRRDSPAEQSGVAALLEVRQYLPGDIVYRPNGTRLVLANRDYLLGDLGDMRLAHCDGTVPQQCYRRVIIPPAKPAGDDGR